MMVPEELVEYYQAIADGKKGMVIQALLMAENYEKKE